MFDSINAPFTIQLPTSRLTIDQPTTAHRGRDYLANRVDGVLQSIHLSLVSVKPWTGYTLVEWSRIKLFCEKPSMLWRYTIIIMIYDITVKMMVDWLLWGVIYIYIILGIVITHIRDTYQPTSIIRVMLMATNQLSLYPTVQVLTQFSSKIKRVLGCQVQNSSYKLSLMNTI